MTLTNFDLVIFGATGDLSMRKLLPSLYHAHCAHLLHPEGRILAVSRTPLNREQFLIRVEKEAKTHLHQTFSKEHWQSFIQRLDYLCVNIHCAADFDSLQQKIAAKKSDAVIVYLSTAPHYFAPTCEQLARVGLNHFAVRIVLEKPLGSDLSSAQAINRAVLRFFQEKQIYRIDHYLGKESLQNILPLRFANPLLTQMWNKDWIESVEITIAEELGVEDRGEFYDNTGALRDMVQNHMLQMLCLIAMQTPKSLLADDVRNEKLRVLQALKMLPEKEVAHNVVRAQYDGYTKEANIAPNSQTETFVAIRAHIDLPHWQGVPFYLRTGKHLNQRAASIILNFKEQDTLFGRQSSRLLIQIQPNEKIEWQISVKKAGNCLSLAPAAVGLDLKQITHAHRADAYELLLLEVIDGRLNLFNRADELEAAWRWIMPILNAWQKNLAPLYHYPSGSEGPIEAHQLLARDGAVWHDLTNIQAA